MKLAAERVCKILQEYTTNGGVNGAGGVCATNNRMLFPTDVETKCVTCAVDPRSAHASRQGQPGPTRLVPDVNS